MAFFVPVSPDILKRIFLLDFHNLCTHAHVLKLTVHHFKPSLMTESHLDFSKNQTHKHIKQRSRKENRKLPCKPLSNISICINDKSGFEVNNFLAFASHYLQVPPWYITSFRGVFFHIELKCFRNVLTVLATEKCVLNNVRLSFFGLAFVHWRR